MQGISQQASVPVWNQRINQTIPDYAKKYLLSYNG
jgi:hypothetical protein